MYLVVYLGFLYIEVTVYVVYTVYRVFRGCNGLRQAASLLFLKFTFSHSL
jgi:hypothetical protein